MKALFKKAIDWLKGKLLGKVVEEVLDTKASDIAHQLEEAVKEKASEEIDKAVKRSKHLQKATKAINKVVDAEKVKETVVKAAGEAVSASITTAATKLFHAKEKLDAKEASITVKEEKKEEVKKDASDSKRLTEDTKAYFDAKLHDTYEDETYDIQLVVIHHISEDDRGKFVEIEEIQTRSRSARVHKEERNLITDDEHELAKAIIECEEKSGVEVLELFHLPIPNTKIQSTKD